MTRKGIGIGVTVTAGGNGFFASPHMLRRSMIFGDEDLEAFKAKLATFTRTGTRSEPYLPGRFPAPWRPELAIPEY